VASRLRPHAGLAGRARSHARTARGVGATRARIATEGFGARLLALQDPDGQRAGGAFFPAGFEPLAPGLRVGDHTGDDDSSPGTCPRRANRADLEPYFVTSPHDDFPGILQTYSFRRRVGIIHLLSGSPFIVGVIDAVVSGLLGSLVFQAIQESGPAHIFVGFSVALATLFPLGLLWYQRIRRARRGHRARFPGSDHGRGGG
jgi:hypothetical protein